MSDEQRLGKYCDCYRWCWSSYHLQYQTPLYIKAYCVLPRVSMDSYLIKLQNGSQTVQPMPQSSVRCHYAGSLAAPRFQVSTAHYERTIWGCAMCCQGSPICHSTGLVASGSTMSITPNVNLVGVVYVVSTCMPLEPDKVGMMQAIGRRWSYLRALAVALIDWWVTVPQMCCTTKCRSGPCCNRRIMHI
jgi:hypothetical protein